MLQLLGLRGAGDDAGDGGARQEPSEGEFEQRVAAPGAKLFQSLHNFPIRFGEVAVGKALERLESRVFRNGPIGRVFAGEQAAGERKVRQHAEAKSLHGWKEFALHAAHQETVLVLTRDETVEIEMARGPLRVGNLPGGEIRAADITDFAGADEVVEARRVSSMGVAGSGK